MNSKNKITLTLTAQQLRVLLVLIDCNTDEKEPDWFFNKHTGKIDTPFLKEDGTKYRSRTVQSHISRMLDAKMFPDCF